MSHTGNSHNWKPKKCLFCGKTMIPDPKDGRSRTCPDGKKCLDDYKEKMKKQKEIETDIKTEEVERIKALLGLQIERLTKEAEQKDREISKQKEIVEELLKQMDEESKSKLIIRLIEHIKFMQTDYYAR